MKKGLKFKSHTNQGCQNQRDVAFCIEHHVSDHSNIFVTSVKTNTKNFFTVGLPPFEW
jgi:hypothetical protein